MQTKLLFQNDSYLKQFEAKVLAIRPDGGIILDQTAFYYASGGQPCDNGKLILKKDGSQIEIKEVRKIDGEVAHVPSAPNPSLVEGDGLSGEINWERRHRLMRTHTAGHVLSSIMYKEGVLITGNQLGIDHTRFDFNMENFEPKFMEECIRKANEECAKGRNVRVYSLPRAEAEKLPGMVKLANALPPEIQELRIVEIDQIDTQADGGTHVRNTSEVGEIVFEKAQNKGATNRRIYFTLKP